MPSLSLRSRLLLLVLAIALPAAAMLWALLIEFRRAQVADAEAALGRIARSIAADVDAGVGAALQLVTGLAHAPVLGAGDREACSRFLAPLLKRFPQYTGLATFLPNGELHCDGTLSGRTFSVKDRPYFERSVRAEAPFAAEVQIGRGSGAAVIPVLHATRDAARNLRYLLLAAINLESVGGKRSGDVLPPGALVEIWRSDGTLLARTEGGRELLGRTYPGSGISNLVQRAESLTVAKATGITGVPRVWAIAVSTVAAESGLRVAVGLPEEVLRAPSQRALRNTAIVFGLVLLTALAFAWWLAERWIDRPMKRLAAVAERLQAGHLAARVGGPYSRDEIGTVARQFDQALATIEELTANLERRVVERTQQLEEANHAKSDFLANITHELRTPLNSIIGFAELLKDEVPGPLNAKQTTFAADILAGGQRLLVLVEGILEMSRLDASGAALEREPVEIGAALEERVAVHRKPAEARGVTMRLDLAPDACSADLDPKALRRMLDALIDNAIKFNREGGQVAVSARRANGALEIAVADTGIGIAQEDLVKLFKPLAQLDAGLARRHGGLGLGLALARRLAELHGGTIKVESESAKGSTFTLRLPAEGKR